MRRMLLFVSVALCAFLVAAALRVHDAPYLAYEHGDIAGAVDGLIHKAEDGDGFAAYLVARSYQLGQVAGADPKSAVAWYVAAARAGEIRAVADLLEMVLASSPDAAACRKSTVLLELASRTGALGALIATGRLYENGTCGMKDLVRAASYYEAAVRLDRRFADRRDHVLAQLSGGDAARVKPIPFDLDTRDVLARVVNDAPALLPDSLR